MTYRGFFSSVDVPGAPQGTGGLERNLANRGTFLCRDAGRLFSMASGEVRMSLILPYDLSLGVYSPLEGTSGAEFEDYVLWAVNMGEGYITQPGMYAALTPSGMEFTLWSSAGRYTVMDTTTSCAAGAVLNLWFFWDSGHLACGGNMAIASQGVLTERGRAAINNDSLTNIYHITGGPATIPRNAEFVALDSPYGNHGLNCTITDLRTYSIPRGGDVPDRPSSSSSSSSGSSGSSSSSSNGLVCHYLAQATIPFTFLSGTGPAVDITRIEMATVSRGNVSLNSNGSSGAARDAGGDDVGAVTGSDPLPAVPLDLPHGINEVKDLS